MRSDIIEVLGTGSRMDSVLQEAEKLTAYKGLTGKNALHLRLLTEEMTALMRSITGEREGRFWIEDDQKGLYSLHLDVVTRMNSVKREQLLSTATSGRNESARGLMGRIRDFFDQTADEDVARYASPMLLPDAAEYSATPTLDWEWSLNRYVRKYEEMDDAARTAQGAEADWDELEKSVVAKVADDVKVSLQGSHVSLTILKRMG